MKNNTKDLNDFNELINLTIKKDCSLIKYKIAFLSNSSSQFIIKILRGYGLEFNLNYEIRDFGFDQIDNNIFNTNSELYLFKPDFVIILHDTHRLINDFYNTSHSERENFHLIKINYFNEIYNTINRNLNTKIISNSFIEHNDGVYGNFSTKIKSSLIIQLKLLNISLYDLSSRISNLFILQLDTIVSDIGFKKIFDSKLFYLYNNSYSIESLPTLAKNINSIIVSSIGKFKKCIILDLDNTMWGGIVGDDGLFGIQIGNLGVGKAFTDFQFWLLELYKRGIIICICSKNNESIAKEPFLKHPDMVIKLEHISFFVANWNNKVDNINYIQKSLNISFDSMVFIDDNKFEREMVKSVIHEITVPEIPDDPTEYLSFLKSLNLFETSSYNKDDFNRTKSYQNQIKTEELKKTYNNEDEFLFNLEMKCQINFFNSYNLPRLFDLSQRSNQFNLRTKRFTEDDLSNFSTSNNFICLCLNLDDKFNKYGLISFIILEILDQNHIFITNWVMSCRVFNRHLENFIMNYIVKIAQEKNIKFLIGEYIPTEKNKIIENLYKNFGFELNKENVWILDISNYIIKKNFIKIIEHEKE